MRRDRRDIEFDLLCAAKKAIPKTRLMYDAHLSWTQLQSYMNRLMKDNLLKCCDGDLYQTTETGLEYIKVVRKVKRMSP